jgi:hypothetical protein
MRFGLFRRTSPHPLLTSSARLPQSDRARSDAILNQSSVNLRDRTASWQKSGWKGFNPESKPYEAEEVRRERELYGIGSQ